MSGAAKLVHGVVEFLEFIAEQVPKGLHAAHTHVAEVLERQGHAFKALDEDLKAKAHGVERDITHEGRPTAPSAGSAVRRVVSPRDLATDEERFQAYLSRVEELDVRTPVDASNFYSGGRGPTAGIARREAEREAERLATTTLERTEGGKWLDDEGLFKDGSPLSESQATAVWQRLSERYAQQASGHTHAHLYDPYAGSVFYLKELPALEEGLRSGRITAITIHDMITKISTTWTGPPGPPIPPPP